MIRKTINKTNINKFMSQKGFNMIDDKKVRYDVHSLTFCKGNDVIQVRYNELQHLYGYIVGGINEGIKAVEHSFTNVIELKTHMEKMYLTV